LRAQMNASAKWRKPSANTNSFCTVFQTRLNQRFQFQRELQVIAVAQDGEGVFCTVLAEEGENVVERIIGGGISVNFFKHVADGNAGEFGGRFLDDAGDSEGAEVRRSGDENEAAHIRDEEIVEVRIWLEDD